MKSGALTKIVFYAVGGVLALCTGLLIGWVFL